MYLTLVLFVLGVLIPSQMPVLPVLSDLIWLLVAILLALAQKATRPFVGLIVGFAYCIYSGQSWLDHKIPSTLEGIPVQVRGTITQMPLKTSLGWRIRFSVDDGQLGGRQLSLGWYDSEAPAAGETWDLRVKLSRPRGTVNPGLFDYEAWLLSQKIHGTGYVLPGANKTRLDERLLLAYFERLRQRLVKDLTNNLEPSPALNMVLALLVGDSSQLSGTTWDTLSATGTNHLLIVSGLHVGLVTGLVFWLLNRVFYCPLWLAVTGSISVAAIYSLITGFGLPVQRALMMSSIGLLVMSSRRQTSVWHAWVLAMASVLLLNPFASLSAGFWLSFAAVAGLLFAFQGRRVAGISLFPSLFKSQWTALLVTAPFLLCWVYKFSIASVIANLIAIPVVSLIIVPALLLAFLTWLLGWDFGFYAITTISLSLLSSLFSFLSLLAGLDWVVEQPARFSWVLVVAMFGSSLILLPKISVPRWVGVFCWLPILYPILPRFGGTSVDLLDVGQGLSVLIRHDDHAMVYDAGPAIGRFDAGKQVVVPRLRQLGLKKLDMMVVSHGDNDHAGGALSIQNAMLVDDFVRGPCLESRSWLYGELSVRLLMADGIDPSNSGNDLSCVLLIETPNAKILLPGDIEARAEQGLIAAGLDPVDLLVAPHHGSSSSSGPAFLNALSPRWALFSTGYQNRFGHPHKEVSNRYLDRGVRIMNTADSGMISFHFSADGAMEVIRARESHRRFWYDSRSQKTMRGR
jgi:competence protein ComEC